MTHALWLSLFLSLTLHAQIIQDQLNNRQTGGVHHSNSSTSADVVDGAIHPELIPDRVAYRLYLVTVSEMPNASPEAKNRQLSYLANAGLKNNDLQWTIEILQDFKMKYTELINQYNSLAQAAEKEGRSADYESFVFQRDELVQATLDRLRSFLTPDGLESLDTHVRGEKRRMKLGLREVQP